MTKPVYPKTDPEYRKRILDNFYTRVKNMDWEAKGEDEYQGKPRGRKPKPKQGPPPEYYNPRKKRVG